MQDRLLVYNRDLEEAGNVGSVERVRKTSVLFDQPMTMIDGVDNVVEPDSEITEVEVHQVRPAQLRS